MTKNEKRDFKTNWQSEGGWQRSRSVSEKVSYTIEVANAAAGPVTDVVVKWALLVRPRDSKTLQVVEGERACSLQRMQKIVFDTDVLDLSGSIYEDSTTGYRSRSKGELLGYCVEAIVGGRVVTSDIQPADAKLKIQQAKSPAPQEASGEPGKPRRH